MNCNETIGQKIDNRINSLIDMACIFKSLRIIDLQSNQYSDYYKIYLSNSVEKIFTESTFTYQWLSDVS